MRDSTLAGAAWGGLWPKNHGRKAKPLAQCHGTTLFLSIKAAGESTPQLPWHRLCVRFNVVFSLASVDSCFHLSLCLGCFCRGWELLQENELLFLSAQCLPGSPSEPCSMVSLSPVLGTQRVCFLVTKRQDLIGTRHSLLSHLVIPALKWELIAVF